MYWVGSRCCLLKCHYDFRDHGVSALGCYVEFTAEILPSASMKGLTLFFSLFGHPVLKILTKTANKQPLSQIIRVKD